MSEPRHLASLERAEALAQDGRLDEAARLCDAVLAEAAEDAAALNLKGFCLAAGGRPAEALPFFKRARLHLPTYPAIRYNLGKALEETGDAAGALAEYDEVLRLDGGHAGARRSRAALRALSGDESGAAADFDELLRREPEDARGFFLRGAWRLSAGRFRESLPDLERALALDPELRPEIEALVARAKETFGGA
ncbi:MAG: tetratricopeptide repeat protein [Elusimicrobia bacterium]|nr:tetratricopeptide repeat protein [Elusimicrobiota bacterium]